MKHWAIGVLAKLALIATVGMAAAQDESTNRVNAEREWSVFVEDNPTQCWVVSAPQQTVNTRGGNVVSVTRGEIALFVSYWPAQNRRGEVSFTGGYPFAPGSTVSLTIGSSTFELFTDGENAWAASPEVDRQIIAAMRAGAEAVVRGRSSRGTDTRDTFSLIGFTAAVADAESRCGS